MGEPVYPELRIRIFHQQRNRPESASIIDSTCQLHTVPTTDGDNQISKFELQNYQRGPIVSKSLYITYDPSEHDYCVER